MKNKMKKVFKYILIAILLFAGLAFACVLYLFFVRGSSIFGITYISTNQKKFVDDYTPDQVNNIEINSYDYDLLISNTSYENVYCTLTVGTFGFTHVAHSQFDLKTEYLGSTKTLKINITEPTGAVVNSSSNIVVGIPNTLTDLATLTINNHNARVTVNLPKTTVKVLTYDAQNGSINLNECCGLEEMNLNIRKGSAYLSESLKINNSVTNLKMSSGLLSSQKIELGNVHLLENTRSVIRIDKCVSFESNKPGDYGGTIAIGETSKIVYTGADTVFIVSKIENLTDPESLIITLTKSGSITIDELNATANLETNSGKIQINTAHSIISKASSRSGNITITNAKKSIRCNSESGTVYIAFAEDTSSYDVNTTYRSVIVDEIKSGKLTIVGVEHFDITSTGKSTINIEARCLYDANRIRANQGSVYVKFDKESRLVIGAKSMTGTTRVNVSSVPEYNGTINNTNKIYLNCSELDEPLDNSLLVTGESASIAIVANNLK